MPNQLLTIFWLLAVFQVKHFLADYPLQRPYMLRKGATGGAWVLPLALHAGVHGTLTLAVCLALRESLWWLAALDFAVHFIVDRVKAGPSLGGRWKPDNQYFWWALGADQALHHLTHYFIIYRLAVAPVLS